MSMREVVIVSAARTPIGRFLGSLADVPAPKLGAVAIRAALERSGLAPDAVDEVILGHVLSAGVGQSPARQAQLAAGIPSHVGAVGINKVCGSGLKAVALAAQAIRAGDADAIVCGGMESMSQAPHFLAGARQGFKLGHQQLRDVNVHDGLWDAFHDMHMGMTAELVAERYAISREEQDAYAAASHQKAAAARAKGRFAAEIAPVEVQLGRGPKTSFADDEAIRADTTAEGLARLKPVFKPAGGSVTAGNAPGLNDGAAALVVMAREVAEAGGLRPLARITGYATGHRAPEWVMMAPVDGVQKLCARLGLPDASSFDLVELNEAFSVAAIAVTRELGLDPARVNVNGGAVALGHPIGASGARILVTLVHALRAHGLRSGLAALCLGGGGSVALSVEALDAPA